jgi:hypothetical protein
MRRNVNAFIDAVTITTIKQPGKKFAGGAGEILVGWSKGNRDDGDV